MLSYTNLPRPEAAARAESRQVHIYEREPFMTFATMPPNALKHAKVFGDPQLHTDGELLSLAFATDGTLYSVEEPGVVRHWDPANGTQLDWQTLSDLETLWRFSNDCRVLASASNDLSIWDPTSGNLLTAISQPSWVTAIAFHGDPAFVATGHDDGVVRLWDVAGHQLMRAFAGHTKPISALAFSADGKRLASAGEDKIIVVWDAESGAEIAKLAGHTDRIPALAWHPSGDLLVSAGWDTTARIWDIRKKEPVLLLNAHATQVTAVAFSKDGKWLASADSAPEVHLWDFEQRKERHRCKGPKTEIHQLAFSPDGKLLACNGENLIHLWSTETGLSEAGSDSPQATRTTIAVGSDGPRLVSNGGGGRVRVWNALTGKSELQLENKGTVHGLAWSPNARWIAGAAGSHVRLWDAKTGAARIDLDGSEEPFTTLAFAPDSSLLATASNVGLAVWVWRVEDGEPILLIPDALDGCTVESLAFHPQGRLLAAAGIDWMATSGSDGAICLWDIVDRCEVALFPGGATCIAYHPGGRYLASASVEQTICLWDTEEKEIVAELSGHEGAVTALAYNHDGSLLASGGEDRLLRLWNDEGDELVLVELDCQVRSLAFSPDGKHLYTANGNTTCYQFEVAKLLK